MKNVLSLGAVLFLSIYFIQAQSGLKLTDYYYNPIQYNPAYAGVTDGMYVKGSYLSQWIGFDDAPVTQTLDVQKRFNNKYALGLSLSNDDFGPIKNLNIEGNFALHLMANDEIGFVLGLKAGLNNFTRDYGRLAIFDPTEVIFNSENLNALSPLVGAGLYVFAKNWFFGIAVPNLIAQKITDDFSRDSFNNIPHVYSSMGYNFNPNKELLLKTQVLSQIVEGAPMSFLLSSRLFFKDKIGLGVHIQPNALYGASLLLNLNDQFMFTYAYDRALSNLNQYADGNHYFGVSIKLGANNQECDCLSEVKGLDRAYIIR